MYTTTNPVTVPLITSMSYTFESKAYIQQMQSIARAFACVLLWLYTERFYPNPSGLLHESQVVNPLRLWQMQLHLKCNGANVMEM